MDSQPRPPAPSPEDLSAAAAAMEDLLRGRPELRSALRRLATWLLDLASEPPSAAPAHPTAAAAQEAASPPPLIGEMDLHIGDARVRVPVRDTGGPARVAPAPIRGPVVVGHAPPPGAEYFRGADGFAPPPAERTPDLQLVVTRCALKAECCDWAIQRRRRMAERADFDTSIRPTDVELLNRAKALPQCYIWPLDPYGAVPNDAELELAGACYKNLGAAAQLALDLRQQSDDQSWWEEAYALLAEAQSAVRVLLESLGLRADRDQEDAFFWLKTRTAEDSILVQRHMRLLDPADPQAWLQLDGKISALRGKWEERRQRDHARDRLFNKARYHCRRLVDAVDGGDPTDPEYRNDWQKVVTAFSELVALGVPPSNVEIREQLLPIIDRMPDDLGREPNFERIAVEIDNYLASREGERTESAASGPADPAVRAAAELLRGRVVVMIGGERRPHSQALLERELELGELRWISTRSHQSIAEFEPYVARPETALVILAIRWSSHSFEGVKSMCQRYGKPFVRLPGGYGVNQVARQVMLQVSGQLATTSSGVGARSIGD